MRINYAENAIIGKIVKIALQMLRQMMKVIVNAMKNTPSTHRLLPVIFAQVHVQSVLDRLYTRVMHAKKDLSISLRIEYAQLLAQLDSL